MTREEIIQGLQFTVDMFSLDTNTGETLTEPRNELDKITIDSCRGAIKALKQKPIIDKIRAEIMLLDYDTGDILEIIDKYKKEVK